METITAFFMSVSLAIKLRGHINYKLMTFPLISTIIFSFVGVFTLMSTTESLLCRIFGGVLILLSIYFIIFSNKVKFVPTPASGLAVGVISGFFSGLFSIGGPPIVIYFLSITDEKMEYNASLQFYFLSG
jgi:uncharacterized membrane protein YfcA